jgi:PAS domain S-box-containing protein
MAPDLRSYDTGDEVLAGLTAVVESLQECSEYIAKALERAELVAEARRAGTPLAEIFDQQEGKSVLELMTAVLGALSDTGSTLRRAEARGLYAEGLSMEKIARLFGVSRQRVSSLLRAPLLHAPLLERRVSPPSDRRRGGLAFTDPEFRMIAEALPHIVWVATPDGSIEYLNTHGADYVGGPREATYDWDWVGLGVVHPDDAGRVLQRWEEAARSGTPFELDYRIRRSDGAWRWHACRALPFRGPDGRVVKWMGTGTDIEDYLQHGSAAGERT